MLHPTQSGFRQKHCCQTYFILIDKQVQGINGDNINLAVLFDFKEELMQKCMILSVKHFEIDEFDNAVATFFK